MNVQRLQALRRAQRYHLLPVQVGMMLEIHEKIGEGNNQRIWRFKGLVIKVKKPCHSDGTFTVRGKTSGATIEKIYPLSFVNFEHVYLLDVYKVAKAKLYYIREKIGKDAKMKSLITAEKRGLDLLVLAQENLAQELPEIELASEVTPIDEKTADDIIDAQEDTEEVVAEEVVAEEVVAEEPVVEEAVVEEPVVEEAVVEESVVEEPVVEEAVVEEPVVEEPVVEESVVEEPVVEEPVVEEPVVEEPVVEEPVTEEPVTEDTK